MAGRRGLLLVLALAAAARLLVFAVAVQAPSRFMTEDSFQYDLLARRFGDAYVHLHARLLDLSLLRTPGYPAFLAAVYGVAGRSWTAAAAVEILIGVATVLGVYLLARRLLGPGVALVAALALALDPISIAMTSNVTTETVFAGLWVAAALLWVAGLQQRRSGLLAAAGLAFGVSVLVRPIGLYLPVLLVPLTFWLVGAPRTRRLVASAAILVSFAVPVGLWAARNHHETGVVTVSTIGAHNLLDYRAADALAIDEGSSRPEEADRLEARARRAAGAHANGAVLAQAESSLAWHTLAHHPKGAVLTTVRGLGRVLFGPGRAEMLRLVTGSTETVGLADRAAIAAEAALLFALLLAAVGGVVALVRRRAWLALAVPLALAVYDIALSAGAEGNARLRMPASPFLALLAGAGLVAAWRWVVSSRAAPSAAR